MHMMRQAVYRQYPDLPLSFPPLRRCNRCGRSQDKDSTIQLRKCGGCSRALYCNKMCQKAAWPNHKLICRDNDNLIASLANTGQLPPDMSSLGYPSLSAFAFVLQNGGIDWSQNRQKMLSLLIVPAATIGTPERNPARTFRLSSHRFSVLDEHFASCPAAVDEWARWQPLRKSLLADDEAKEALLKGVVAPSAGSVNAGIPLRSVEESGLLAVRSRAGCFPG
ncbi:hypothetical protein LXA43DRAFT_1186496 [Ganoderma leucocontextum]|nr:hypothetical protein LXA43DRAFT_1186496 [Ganoderma leucocontextum]